MEMGTKGQPPQFGGQWVSADHEMKHYLHQPTQWVYKLPFYGLVH